MENVGIVVAVIVAALGLASVGGAVVYRFKAGAEKEALDSYRNAVEGLQAELQVVNGKNERLEAEVAALKRADRANKDQIQMLSRMVTGVEAISNLENKLDRQFKSVHEHINRKFPDGQG